MGNLDDKTIGIICLTILAGASLWFLGVEAKDVVIPIATGIAGLVVGRTEAKTK